MMRNLRHWLDARNKDYIAARSRSIVSRYGITSSKAQTRLIDCVDTLGSYGCFPTFATPGRVVRRSPAFFRELQRGGSEIAVHGYDHVDFRALSVAEARTQFKRAMQTFTAAGIEFHGFRCPYLSFTDELLEAVPTEALQYSSNQAIAWAVVPDKVPEGGNGLMRGLRRLYDEQPASATVAVPRFKGSLLEIPASLPDDLQLYDALALGEEGVRVSWIEVLRRTHERGELFTALFHPEAFEHVRRALEGVLREANGATPAVWIARLREINEWWREKADFSARIGPASIDFDCSDRATILVRGLAADGATRPWHGSYRVLKARTLALADGAYPLIGVSPEFPPEAADFLRNQGYVLHEGDDGRQCTISLDAATVKAHKTEVELLDYVESSQAALVRFWRWPNGARSALSVTGDLDALSLVDYGARLFNR
jgi:peptidoglycan/xylan/chitin deacetylase (PgdA/CDA1 family)